MGYIDAIKFINGQDDINVKLAMIDVMQVLTGIQFEIYKGRVYIVNSGGWFDAITMRRPNEGVKEVVHGKR